MKKALQLASAFMGVIIGAGFASGREIVQYFTSFGIWRGTTGAVLAAALFAFLGMSLMRIGSRLRVRSHKEAVHAVSGRYLGALIDWIIVLTLFGVGVVMIAGAGSNLAQQFGVPFYAGAVLMTVLVFATALLRLDRIVRVIGSVTPFLILFIVIISLYCFLTWDTPVSELHETARRLPTTLPNWWVSAVNYVSFNIAVAASMALVMGGSEPDARTAALGGLLGGLGVGVLILLSHLSIFSRAGQAAVLDMPLLKIVDDLSPVLGALYAVVLFGMIFNTAAGMFFPFVIRFAARDTPAFRIVLALTMAVAIGLSLFGFSNLVGYLYPLIGYLGLILISALIFDFVRFAARRNP